ncbi:MAG: hypothetical protein V4543_14825 [Bacteroidota bacterium]
MVNARNFFEDYRKWVKAIKKYGETGFQIGDYNAEYLNVSYNEVIKSINAEIGFKLEKNIDTNSPGTLCVNLLWNLIWDMLVAQADNKPDFSLPLMGLYGSVKWSYYWRSKNDQAVLDGSGRALLLANQGRSYKAWLRFDYIPSITAVVTEKNKMILIDHLQAASNYEAININEIAADGNEFYKPTTAKPAAEQLAEIIMEYVAKLDEKKVTIKHIAEELYMEYETSAKQIIKEYSAVKKGKYINKIVGLKRSEIEGVIRNSINNYPGKSKG